MKKTFILACFILASFTIKAQTPCDTLPSLPPMPEDAAPVFNFAPVGRVLFDGAAYVSNDSRLFPDGVSIPDVRAGIRGSYGKWSTRIDIGYSYYKLALKDMFVQYNFNDSHRWRLGYFIYHYGLQGTTNASMKISQIEPVAESAMANPRFIGTQYVYSGTDCFATAALYAESQAMSMNSTSLGRTGWGAISRLAWHPLHSAGNVAQLGISFQGSSPTFSVEDGNPTHDTFTLSANFPTRVARVEAAGAEITDVRSMFKFTPELLLAQNSFALESQYYYFQTARKHALPTYRAWGAYGMLRWLATGENYSFNRSEGCLNTPSKGSLELVLGYSYLDTTDPVAGVKGGRISDFNLTANWYINPYIIWRLRAGYSHRWDRDEDIYTHVPSPDINLGSLQTCFQLLF